MKERKTLKQKFLDGDKLSVLDNLRINLLRRTNECDGMCGFYEVCGYCEVYKQRQGYNKGEKN